MTLFSYIVKTFYLPRHSVKILSTIFTGYIFYSVYFLYRYFFILKISQQFFVIAGNISNKIILLLFINQHIFTHRHGDRTRAGASPCWDNDTAEWDCLLSSASIPTIKHDTHDIEVACVYRDGKVLHTCSCRLVVCHYGEGGPAFLKNIDRCLRG